MNLEDVLLRGTRAAQPLATAVAEGQLYSVTDRGYLIEQSRGGVWVTYSGSSSSSGGSGGLIFPLPIDGEDGINGFMGPVGSTGPAGAAGSSGGNWTLLHTRTIVTAAGEDFTTSLGYNEILIVLLAATLDFSASIAVRVSTDGGSTYLSTSGDYKNIPSSGFEQDSSSMNFFTGSATTARTGWKYITNFNGTTNPKLSWPHNMNGMDQSYRIPTTSALNAIRVFPTGGNLTGGTIYIFGR